jgi:ribose/xylose/arabinose/galactoside ABC-type transport system permease subunit
MTTTTVPGPPARLSYRPQQKYIPVLATASLLVLMFSVGSLRYENFGSAQVIMDIFIDNAFLLVVAVGMTFVILTGGIDLSVGAVVALSTILSATLVQEKHWNPLLVIVLMLVLGSMLGAGMGAVIHFFEIQPFIVTLAGMFLARGLCYVISIDSISIDNSFYINLAQTQIPLGAGLHTSPSVVIAVIVVAAAAYVLQLTRLGRTVYAIGGSQQSALLMGLAVGRTKVLVYAISGFCSALGGVLSTFYTLSGYSLNGVGLELDAIAAVVIGGTLLIGGSGYVWGTVLGVLTLGMIQTLITFDGTLSSWWTRIFIGTLLFVFILLQRIISTRRT